ncbi:MAG: MarR family transcriptional regulator [Candidatus Dormibacteraeota bacterium]|nr:MarR family transcriptional regulator [Candidatus Dormibacteraeota bacterium]
MQPDLPEDRDELLQTLLDEAHLLGARLAQSHQRTADAVGIGVTDLLCLEMISANEPVTAGQLAGLVQLTPGAVTGVLDRLERGGFIKRDRDPDDRRRLVVRLDPARQRDMARLLDPLAGALAEVTAGMSDANLRRITDFMARLHPAIAVELARLRPGSLVRDTAATTAVPRSALADARLEIGAGLFDVVLTSGSLGDDLVRSTFEGQQPRIEQEGGTVTLRQRRLARYFGWAGPGVIRLNDAVVWDLALRGGSYRLKLDLKALRLSGLALRGGYGLAATLPPPVGTVPVRVSGGVTDITLERPRGVPIRVAVRGGGHRLAIDDLRLSAADQTGWQTPGYEDSRDRYDIAFTGGTSKLTIGSW